jgi:hypothetical protein
MMSSRQFAVGSRQPETIGLRREFLSTVAAGVALGGGFLLLSAAAAASVPKYGPSWKDTAKTDAKTLVQVMETWKLNQPTPSVCPSLERLKDDSALKRDQNLNDPWGREYLVFCSDDEFGVASVGPDGIYGTEDDIRAGLVP